MNIFKACARRSGKRGIMAGPSMQVPPGYEEHKRERLEQARRRKNYERDTEWKTKYYII